MKTINATIFTIVTLLLLVAGSFPRSNNDSNVSTLNLKDSSRWEQKAITWLVQAQSKNGGWGAGSYAHQDILDPHAVGTDPATTAFAAMALLKSGGVLYKNPYHKNILKALDRILEDIGSRPDNGRITAVSGTQPQRKLGGNIDASMALDFLSEIRKQIMDDLYLEKIDSAAEVCIRLLQSRQAENGSWADGGWAPVLQSAVVNNALESANTHYPVNDSVLIKSKMYHASNYSIDGIRVSEAAGIPLYTVASVQRATAEEAKEAENILNEVVVTAYKIPLIEQDLATAIQSVNKDAAAAKRLAKSYVINIKATQDLKKDAIWNGFGNNGGEEYLSYKMSSEALAKQNKEEWIEWRSDIEPRFRESQNPNGSWSGHHCITSPVFCTSAILLAWNAAAEE